MRPYTVAFTIVYDGIHHLTHKGFTEFMLDYFDKWIIVEGLAQGNGSTSWCNTLPLPPRSTDGTHELLSGIDSKKLLYYSKGEPWSSKDEMLHKVTELLRINDVECVLWQVDVDEVWTKAKLDRNNKWFLSSGAKCGKVRFNHIVGKNENGLLVSRGKWGTGSVARVWRWAGEDFATHEPANLHGVKTYVSLPEKFDHYSYFFENDVIFKSKYYKGYEKLHENWLKIQKLPTPIPCTELLPWLPRGKIVCV